MRRCAHGLSLVSGMILSAVFFQASAQWKQATGPTGAFVFATSGADLYAGQFSVGVLHSTDNGATWKNADSGLTDLDVYALATDGSNLFAGTFGGGVFVSSNGGALWSAIDSGLADLDVISLAASGNSIYAGTSAGGVFVTDMSESVAVWTSQGLFGEPVYAIAVVDTDIYAATFAGMFVSSNGGGIWNENDSVLANTTIYSLDTSGGNLYAGTAGKGVFLSTDGGASWAAVNTGLTDLTINALLSISGNVFAGTDGGVFLTTNGGASWAAVNTGLTPNIIYALGATQTSLFAGTNGYGIWERPLSDMIVLAVHPVEGDRAFGFALGQNYPNPFNPTTTIRYSLPRRADVTLTVYNTLGQQVARLVYATEESGVHQVRFDATALASGVYFYRLQAGALASTKKLVVIH